MNRGSPNGWFVMESSIKMVFKSMIWDWRYPYLFLKETSTYAHAANDSWDDIRLDEIM